MEICTDSSGKSLASGLFLIRGGGEGLGSTPPPELEAIVPEAVAK